MGYTIPIESLKMSCGQAAYEKGLRLYQMNNVQGIRAELSGDIVYIEAQVISSARNSTYYVTLEYDFENRKFVDVDCECPAYETYYGLCKHCVALALKYNRMVNDGQFSFARRGKERRTSDLLDRLMQEKTEQAVACYQDLNRQVLSEPVRLEPALRYQSVPERWTVSFRIGTSAHMYVLKDLTQFVLDLQKEEFVSYGKKLEFRHQRTAFAPESLTLLDLIVENYKTEESFRHRVNGSYYVLGSTRREFALTTANLFRLLRAMPDHQIAVTDEQGRVTVFNIREQDSIQLPIRLEADDAGGYHLELPPFLYLSDQEQHCVVAAGNFVFCPSELDDSLSTVARMSAGNRAKDYFIAEADLRRFCATLLPALIRCSNVDWSGLEQYLPDPCQLKVYLDDDGRYILCRAEAWYGDRKYLLHETATDTVRDFAQEGQLRYLLEQYFPFWNAYGELYFPYDEDWRLYGLLTTGLDEIGQLAEVYLSDRIRRIQLQPQPKLSVEVRLKGNLLDLNIDAERLPQEELQNLLSAYRQRRKYYRMKSGDFLQLEGGSLCTLAELAEGLDVNGTDLKQGQLQVPLYKAYYVDQVLRESDETLTVQRDLPFRSLIRDLKHYEDNDDEVPAGLTTKLRRYQQTGYQWLMTLSRMKLGGILADDMGLGKTVQIIAMLLAHKETLQQKPALIVTPASLVYNWEREIHRFAPELSVCSITGTASERRVKIKTAQTGVVLTSYDLLKRDVEHYQQAYAFCILDEAQYIKNHTTKVARAVKTLQADVRFALTGTPIENRLSELWSIFDFLLPGLLGRYENFRQRYETAIVQQNDQIALKQLQKLIYPFMLRRMKQDVLKDLPEKIENVVYSKMEAEQREIYIANLQRVLESLQSKSDDDVRSEKLQILAELTRLRQLCCDPALLYENYTGGSAKLDTCMELVENAIQSGSKVLVFSQFTTLLERIKMRMEKQQISCFVLTGATSKEKRASLVRQFNETDEADVFLISLKAGGTGLNLTAANVVIHVDPWWNAAVQEQATDRAHRIGQKQNVTVFQLITKDTIEEKIQDLKASKIALSNSVLEGQAVSMASLNKEEILEILQS